METMSPFLTACVTRVAVGDGVGDSGCDLGVDGDFGDDGDGFDGDAEGCVGVGCCGIAYEGMGMATCTVGCFEGCSGASRSSRASLCCR